jgi:hypothetical protein
MDRVRGDELLAVLEQRGWHIQKSDGNEPLLPPDVEARYPRLPVALTAFLERLESCTNADETVVPVPRGLSSP